MIPKLIHLCWFSNDPYPVEIKVCLDSWKRVIPDYEIKLWGYKEAKAIGCQFIDEALEEKRWAFAADAVRFYAYINMAACIWTVIFSCSSDSMISCPTLAS